MPNDTASDLNRRYYTFTGILSLITPSDSQYKQGLDYSEYKQGLADIARSPLGTVDVGHSWHTIRYHIGEIKKKRIAP